MLNGGIYDHLGGGLMRYSTDEFWLVPHFEKMLYDNAQVLELLISVWQGERFAFHAQKIEHIIDWVLREMIAENGAFASTLDADDAGGEGRFYTWTKPEIDALLGDDARLFHKIYDVTPDGNWDGRTILRRLINLVSPKEEERLSACKRILFDAREKRPRPARDDKVLADWNGMMISAMAKAGFTLDRPEWIEAAQRAYLAVKTFMALPGDRLAHSMRNGRVSSVGVLDDLAHMARAGLVLFEITGDEPYLTDACLWAQSARHNHFDSDNSGYFQNHLTAQDIIAWLKPVHDNAVPAANGVLLEVFARLWAMTQDPKWHEAATDLLNFLGPMLPTNFPHMSSSLIGMELLLDPILISVSHSPAMIRVVAETALPNRILIREPGANSIAHICRHGSCSDMISTPQELRRLLT
jgi:hypothetical protein